MSHLSLQPPVRRPLFLRLAACALFIAVVQSCGGGGGCASLAPIPGGHFVGQKNDNAVNLRISPNGVNFINTQWQVLVGIFAPGSKLTLPVNCTETSFDLSVLGKRPVFIADQGDANGNGRLDGKCNASDLPASVVATITGFSLVPQAPDKLTATISLQIATGKLYTLVDTPLCNVKCSIDFNSSRANPANNTIAAQVQFTIDTKWDKLLAFHVASIDGTQICGANGAPAAPKCIDPADLALNHEGGICSYTCDIIDIGVVKNFILGLISPTLQKQIQDAITGQSCQSCTTTAECPKSTDGAATQATCTNKVCTDPATKKCTPKFLGAEGRLDFASLLGSFGAPASAKVDLSLAAGSSVVVDRGLSFGTRAGLVPAAVASCVPPMAVPAFTMVPPPDFDGEAPAGSPYHIGVGISANFLNDAFWATQQSGALCLQLSTSAVSLLDTGLFKTLLPSLGKLATRDGLDAPMMIALRPGRPPTANIGLGTYDAMTHKPVKPLLTLGLSDLNMDFYALIDDRFVRLFTVSADVSLPMSLIFEGCDKVTPALADLRMGITNVHAANSEILAEDPQVLADLIPSVLSLAEPAIAKALEKGFTLPSLGNFKLKVSAAKGVGNIAGTEQYNHLALFAELLPANASCAVAAPHLSASLAASHMPAHDQMRLDGHHALPWPEAVLQVQAEGQGTPEFSVRVDDGLWSDFVRVEGGLLPLAHPRFVLQGRHVISVRARVSEDPHGISEPVEVGFVSDFDPPELSLKVDRSHDRLVVAARDVVSEPSALQFAYRVGSGEFSAFGPAREIALSAVEAQGGVTVRVQDEAHNVGEMMWKTAQLDLRDGALSPPEAPATSLVGCSTSPAAATLALALIALARRRRRS